MEYLVPIAAFVAGFLLALYVRRDRRHIGEVMYSKGRDALWLWYGCRNDRPRERLVRMPQSRRTKTLGEARENAREALVKTRWQV